MATKVNYTDEMTARAVEMYNELGNDGVDAILQKGAEIMYDKYLGPKI